MTGFYQWLVMQTMRPCWSLLIDCAFLAWLIRISFVAYCHAICSENKRTVGIAVPAPISIIARLLIGFSHWFICVCFFFDPSRSIQYQSSNIKILGRAKSPQKGHRGKWLVMWQVAISISGKKSSAVHGSEKQDVHYKWWMLPWHSITWCGGKPAFWNWPSTLLV